ncbi:hypothetical protein [Oceanospirillum linum]|nr:hypothetical protein [Oceanospirillum linum]SEG47967.1 hypothetical protein SAMN04489856_11269 [Oleiphilus messinensis]SMP31208.1 hypothetical protein SAMN06264348_10886 [Oceanospirillum linum]
MKATPMSDWRYLARIAFMTLLLLFLSLDAMAQRPILTVQSEDASVSFTLAEFKALPTTQVRTKTIWTDKEHTFSSVTFKDLMKHLQIDPKGKHVTMIALNDYAIQVAVETLIEHSAFIAYAIDGKRMRIRDKGPLWVLYPFSDQPAINIPPYQAHAIWQLKTLVVN